MAFDARLSRLPSVGSSEITSAVFVNRILERMPDYNPKGDILTRRLADGAPKVKCDLPYPRSTDRNRIYVNVFFRVLTGLRPQKTGIAQRRTCFKKCSYSSRIDSVNTIFIENIKKRFSLF